MQELISNFESLSEKEFSQYAGEWIAVVDNKVVAHSRSFKEVYEFVKNNYPNKKPLIGRIPELIPVVLSVG
jgi:hypothetical protein